MSITIIDIRNNHSNKNESDNAELDSSDDEVTGKKIINCFILCLCSTDNLYGD